MDAGQNVKKQRRIMIDSDEKVEIENIEQKLKKPTEKPKKESSTPRGKEKTAAKAKKAVLKIEDVEKHCFDLINEMRELYKKDLSLNLQAKPAHNKIENVDSICARIVRKDLQEAFLRMGILKELRVWLEPLPDNSLPSQKVKRSILNLLKGLKVSKMDLLNSGIGKIVHFYTKNTREVIEIRKICLSLIKKWKTMIIREETTE
ncbi:Transcription factor iws1 [Glugoides intestinalis]